MSQQCKAIIGNMPGTLTDLQTIARRRPGFEMQLSSLQNNNNAGLFSQREKKKLWKETKSSFFLFFHCFMIDPG